MSLYSNMQICGLDSEIKVERRDGTVWVNITDGNQCITMEAKHVHQLWDALAEAEQTTAEVTDVNRLREALEPFSAFVTTIEAKASARDTPDDFIIHPGLTVGDFRRARVALTPAPYLAVDAAEPAGVEDREAYNLRVHGLREEDMP